MWARLVQIILDYVVGKLIALFAELIRKFKRKEAQEETAKKVDQDVAEKKPRDPEVIKHEEANINS